MRICTLKSSMGIRQPFTAFNVTAGGESGSGVHSCHNENGESEMNGIAGPALAQRMQFWKSANG